ncbi:PTS cellobiose transporter subunit IIB [Enterococcus hirae]|uniref:PTS cellobiose transporter subunit IIB n=1 Tax=Enterococcus hirae TaxID=1354 RepID=UPI00391DF06F
MKKALIICAAGMSSSMMASKTTDLFKKKGEEIEVDAVSATEGDKMIKSSDFDLFLISPQTTMFLDKFVKLGKTVDKPVVSIPFQAYVPIPTGIQKLADLIEENI